MKKKASPSLKDPMSAEIVTDITDGPLDTGVPIGSAYQGTCGAAVSFTDVVHNRDGGESVDVIGYSSHPSSQQILRDIIMRPKDHPGVRRIIAWHHVGYLGIDEDAVVVVVAVGHRVQVFRAVEVIVEDVKTKFPIWKKQELTGGSYNWLGL